ncbi:MAG TPA: OmpA family protein [Edaphocola sp.]|nr:OmpA family protein [Edaphocola sp.]
MRKLLLFLFSFTFLAVTAVSFNACKSKAKIAKTITAKQKKNMKAIYKELKERVAEAKIELEDDKVKLTLPEALLFQVYSTEINPEYLPTLQKIAHIVNKYPKTSILIMGYTDTTGTEDLNKKLSWGRAESVKKALIENDTKTRRLYTWGFGSKNPIADNKTVEGRKQNRRVEFVILYDYQDKANNKNN